MDQQELHYLFQQYFNQQATDVEKKALFRVVSDASNDEVIGAAIVEAWNYYSSSYEMPEDVNQKIRNELFPASHVVPVQLSILKRTWLRYTAAAILILAIVSGIYYLNNNHSKSYESGESVVRDVAPGSDKAIWTLANGKQIELDSTVLDMTQKKSISTIGYNELRTPRGGQYQLILPDGSKVWLNAASSIVYPVAFTGKERKVEITGEVYFEVAKDAAKSFKVLSEGQEIEVLGTSFNVNVYDDEPVKKTTLITGKIRVSVGAAFVAAQNHDENAIRATTRVAPTTILNPNEQAQISTILEIPKIRLITVQTDDIIAWKSNYFNFSNTDIQSVLRQLSRWYDIKIKYQGNIQKTFYAKIPRNLSLSKILEVLESTGSVHFRLNGNELTVLP